MELSAVKNEVGVLILFFQKSMLFSIIFFTLTKLLKIIRLKK